MMRKKNKILDYKMIVKYTIFNHCALNMIKVHIKLQSNTFKQETNKKGFFYAI